MNGFGTYALGLALLALGILTRFAVRLAEPHDLVAPGIRAEVTLVLGANDGIAIYNSKLAPEENPSAVYGALLMRWLAALSLLNVTLDFTAQTGQRFPLVRPAPGTAERLG